MWLLLLTILLVQKTVCVPPLQIKDIECSRDNDICNETFCHLTAKRSNLNWAHFGFFVTKPQNYTFVRTQFFNQYGGDFVQAGPTYFEHICNMSQARSRSLAFVIMMKDLMVYANNFRCPFENNVTVRNFPPDIKLFPEFITTNQYKVTFSIGSMITEKEFFSVTLYMHTTWV